MKNFKKQTEFSLNEIHQILPHRYPFLLIDKLKDIVPFESATGIKNVTFNENYFQGHFDSRSVMPGALIIESMAQSAGTLVMFSLKKNIDKISVYLLTVDKAKFRKPVIPGDQLKFHVEKIKNRAKVWKFQCKGYVEDELVSEAVISAMIMAE